MDNVLRFSGRSAREAKRRALNHWFIHRGALGLGLSEFFARCRVSTDGGNVCITYYPEVRPPGARASAA